MTTSPRITKKPHVAHAAKGKPTKVPSLAGPYISKLFAFQKKYLIACIDQAKKLRNFEFNEQTKNKLVSLVNNKECELCIGKDCDSKAHKRAVCDIRDVEYHYQLSIETAEDTAARLKALQAEKVISNIDQQQRKLAAKIALAELQKSKDEKISAMNQALADAQSWINEV